MKTLAELLDTDNELFERWAETGRKTFQKKAQKEKLRLTKSDLKDLLRQAQVLADSCVIICMDNFDREKAVQTFWKEVEDSGVFLTHIDYLRASVVALSFQSQRRFARTDFGTSRQRSFGQSWGDTIQGLLGEIAFVRLVSHMTEGRLIPIVSAKKMGLDEALTADVSAVLIDKKELRKPAVRASLKSTKLNGRWLDIPYNQVERSDVFVLIKLGTDPDSLLTFLARVSSLTKVLELYEESNLEPIFEKEQAAAQEARKSVKALASHQHPVLAVVAGWQTKEELQETFTAFCHNGRSARKRLTVYSGKGSIGTKAERLPKKIRYSPHFKPPCTLEEISFYPIGDFTEANHSICSIDLLNKDLKELIRKLEGSPISTAAGPSAEQTGGAPHEDA
jgi:hypothetical protein